MTIMAIMTETHLSNTYYNNDKNDNNVRPTYKTNLFIMTIIKLITEQLIKHSLQ